jgi:hypothetical protein
MKCTEIEAKTKWCSFIQIASRGSYGHHNVYNYNSNDVQRFPTHRPKCIASECMSWEWKEANIGVGHCKRT